QEDGYLTTLDNKLPNVVAAINGLGAKSIITGDMPNPTIAANGSLCTDFTLENAVGGVADAHIIANDISWMNSFEFQLNTVLRNRYRGGNFHGVAWDKGF